MKNHKYEILLAYNGEVVDTFDTYEESIEQIYKYYEDEWIENDLDLLENQYEVHNTETGESEVIEHNISKYYYKNNKLYELLMHDVLTDDELCRLFHLEEEELIKRKAEWERISDKYGVYSVEDFKRELRINEEFADEAACLY